MLKKVNQYKWQRLSLFAMHSELVETSLTISGKLTTTILNLIENN